MIDCHAIAKHADWTERTARYPREVELLYLVLGLCGEVGECLNARKKMLRDGSPPTQLGQELLDVLWYACRILKVYGGPTVLAAPDSADLDELLLRLYRAASRVAEVGRWAHACGAQPLEWDGLDEVLGLTCTALKILGIGPDTLEQHRQKLEQRYADLACTNSLEMG